MMQMANAATHQGVEIGKAKLREFLENNEMARQALAVPALERVGDSIGMENLDSSGRRRNGGVEREDDDDDLKI
jgi:hypothetical protein